MTDITPTEAADILVEIKPAVNVDWIIEAAIPPTLPAACDAAYELVAAMDAGWGEFAAEIEKDRKRPKGVPSRVPVMAWLTMLYELWDAYREHLKGAEGIEPCKACRVEAERLRIERMGDGYPRNAD